MRITLDTNVLVRAHIKASGPARRLLDQIKSRGHDLILSQPILYELEEVLSYPRIRRLTQLTDGEIAEHIRSLFDVCILVDIGRPIPFPIRDTDDWVVLRTALAGEVNVLCSNDRDLHHPDLVPIYHTARIEVITDIDLLKRL